MAYQLSLWRIDFDRLTGVYGSDDQSLLDALVPALAASDEDAKAEWLEDQEAGDTEQEPFVASADALRQILAGTVPEAEVDGSPYVRAVAAIYEHLGRFVDGIRCSSGQLQEWDSALAACGIPKSFLPLAVRGAPFPCPPEQLDASIGYLTPVEVGEVRRAIRGPWWSSWFGRSSAPRPQLDREVFRTLCAGIKVACRCRQGLVGVFG